MLQAGVKADESHWEESWPHSCARKSSIILVGCLLHDVSMEYVHAGISHPVDLQVGDLCEQLAQRGLTALLHFGVEQALW
jgi:hypothetical protein